MLTSPAPPRGYHGLAQLMGGDSELAIFRRFSRLNMLALLKLQADMVRLEHEIDGIVQEDAAAGRDFHASFEKLLASDYGSHSAQLDLLARIQDKLKEYNEQLLQVHRLQEISSPSGENLTALREWLRDSSGGGQFLQGLEASTWEPEQAHARSDFLTLYVVKHNDSSIPSAPEAGVAVTENSSSNNASGSGVTSSEAAAWVGDGDASEALKHSISTARSGGSGSNGKGEKMQVQVQVQVQAPSSPSSLLRVRD